jgi:hypothetical protein
MYNSRQRTYNCRSPITPILFVTTIHSSSLSFQPSGYIKPDRLAFQPRPSVNPVANQTDANPGQQPAAASTPRQIQMAIEQSGLNNENEYPQTGNSRTAKALASYSQTRNQSAQSQVSSLISRIDLYA